MRFDPKETDASLLEDGWYSAVIVDAQDTVSKKSGSPMMSVAFRVLGERRAVIREYYVAGMVFHMAKLKKLCEAISLSIEDGEINPDHLIGRPLEIFVKTQIDKSGKFPDKNVASKYRAAGSSQDENRPDGLGGPLFAGKVPF